VRKFIGFGKRNEHVDGFEKSQKISSHFCLGDHIILSKRKLMNAFLAMSIATLFSACGGGGGGTGGGAGFTFGGKVVDGYLQGAIVFLDRNRNGIYDAGVDSLPSTTDANGNYTLTGITSAEVALYPIVVEVPAGAIDQDTGQPIPFPYSMKAPPGAPVINPMTTLVQTEMDNNPTLTSAQAQARVMQKVGLPANSVLDLTADYVAQAAAGGASAADYARIHAISQAIAASVATNYSDVMNATPAGIERISLVNAIVEKVMAQLSTISMYVDQAIASTGGFDPATTPLLIAQNSNIKLVIDQIMQEVLQQQAKYSQPQVGLIGSQVMTLVQGATFTDPGAVAKSNIDGDISASVVVAPVGPAVNTAIVGNYVLTYNVTDAAGNKAPQVVRVVNVIAAPDTTAPTITLIGGNVITLTAGLTPYLEQGASAIDPEDGDISSSVVIGGSVKSGKPGTYTLTYDVADGAGNPATQVTRTVTVVAGADTTPPVIMLNGASLVTVIQNSAYTDNGAKLVDLIDGTIAVTGVSTVNTAVVGRYAVTFNGADVAGNPAAQVVRTVQVIQAPDTTPPVITLNGNANVLVNQGAAYQDAGAIAADAVDGDLTTSMVTVNPVNTSSASVYQVIYQVSDAAGNQATATRTVTVQAVADTTPPVIAMLGSPNVTVVQGSTYLDAGAIAVDMKDGNLTSSIVTVNSVNTAIAGPYTVTYDVSDVAGNAAVQVTRTVNVTNTPAAIDNTPPQIALIGSSTVTVAQGVVYTDAGATASDIQDGILTGSIVTVNPVSTATVGTYTVTYNVMDAAGNAATQVARTVIVADKTAPVVTAPAAVTVQATGATTAVTLGAATVTDNVSVGLVATATPAGPYAVGVHTITWSATDAAGNTSTATQTVTVQDTTAPVVTAPAAVTVQATGPTTAVTLGAATVVDAVSAGLVATATPAGPYAVGVYTITWSATDAAGNTGTATQTVTVQDTTPPVFTGAPLAAVLAEATGVNTSVALTTPAATDVFAVTVTNNAPATFPLGLTVVTWTATDANGQVATTTQNVTVQDTTAPVVTAPVAVTVQATGATTLVALGAATVTDAVSAGLVATATPAGPYAVGVHTIIWSATDAAGNTGAATQTVTVQDTIAPVVTAPAAIIAEATGATTVVALGAATVTDAGSAGLVATAAPVGPYAVGVHTITWSATDAAGNTGTATQMVTVQDTTPPVFTGAPLAAVVAEATGVNTSVALATPAATDVFAVTVTSNAPATFPLGLTVVTWTATDANGLTATTTQNVTAQDTTPAVITLNPLAGSVIINSLFTDPGAVASDVVDGNITIVGVGTVNTAVLGPYTLTYDYTDAAGNVSSQAVRTVNVVNAPDLTAPVITVGSTFTIEATGTTTAVSAVAASTSALDAVDGAVTPVASPAGPYAVGTHTITWTATDLSGNASTATQTIIVQDTTAPTISILGANPYAMAVGGAYVDAGATATDLVDGDVTVAIVTTNNGINGLTMSGGAIPTQYAGNYTVTYSVGDAAGNTATLTRSVNVGVATGVINGTVTNTYGVAGTQYVVLVDMYSSAWQPIAYQPVAGGAFSFTGLADGSYYLMAFADLNANGAYDQLTDSSSELRTGDGGEPVLIVNAASGVATLDQAFALTQTTAQLSSVTGSTITVALDIGGLSNAIYGTATNNSGAVGQMWASGYFGYTDPVTGALTGWGPIQSSNQVDPSGNYINSGQGTGTPIYGVGVPWKVTVFVDVNGNGLQDPNEPFVDSATVNVNAVYGVRSQQNLIVPADTTPPVIALNGSATVNVPVNTAYTDQGATAADNIDGNITANIAVVNPVNTAVVGTYTVTYNVSDAALNAATQVTRTVNVFTPAPMVSLVTGGSSMNYFGSWANQFSPMAFGFLYGAVTLDTVTNKIVEVQNGSDPATGGFAPQPLDPYMNVEITLSGGAWTQIDTSQSTYIDNGAGVVTVTRPDGLTETMTAIENSVATQNIAATLSVQFPANPFMAPQRWTESMNPAAVFSAGASVITTSNTLNADMYSLNFGNDGTCTPFGTGANCAIADYWDSNIGCTANGATTPTVLTDLLTLTSSTVSCAVAGVTNHKDLYVFDTAAGDAVVVDLVANTVGDTTGTANFYTGANLSCDGGSIDYQCGTALGVAMSPTTTGVWTLTTIGGAPAYIFDIPASISKSQWDQGKTKAFFTVQDGFTRLGWVSPQGAVISDQMVNNIAMNDMVTNLDSQAITGHPYHYMEVAMDPYTSGGQVSETFMEMGTMTPNVPVSMMPWSAFAANVNGVPDILASGNMFVGLNAMGQMQSTSATGLQTNFEFSNDAEFVIAEAIDTSSNTDPYAQDSAHIMLMVRAPKVAPTLASVAGTYRIVLMGQDNSISPAAVHGYAEAGTLTLDGVGGLTYSATNSTLDPATFAPILTPVNGVNTYTVDPYGAVLYTNGTGRLILSSNGQYGLYELSVPGTQEWGIVIKQHAATIPFSLMGNGIMADLHSQGTAFGFDPHKGINLVSMSPNSGVADQVNMQVVKAFNPAQLAPSQTCGTQFNLACTGSNTSVLLPVAPNVASSAANGEFSVIDVPSLGLATPLNGYVSQYGDVFWVHDHYATALIIGLGR